MPWPAAKSLGWEQTVDFVEDDPTTATGYNIADNREFSEWDVEALVDVVTNPDAGLLEGLWTPEALTQFIQRETAADFLEDVIAAGGAEQENAPQGRRTRESLRGAELHGHHGAARFCDGCAASTAMPVASAPPPG